MLPAPYGVTGVFQPRGHHASTNVVADNVGPHTRLSRSAFGSEAGVQLAGADFRFTPQKQAPPSRLGMSVSDHFRTHALQQIDFYSITSSARTSSAGGISMPSALAVVRLMTRS